MVEDSAKFLPGLVLENSSAWGNLVDTDASQPLIGRVLGGARCKSASLPRVRAAGVQLPTSSDSLLNHLAFAPVGTAMLGCPRAELQDYSSCPGG